MKTFAQVRKVMEATEELCDITWQVRDGEIHALITCNDVFSWGTADAEEVTPGDVMALIAAFTECRLALDEQWWVAYNWGDVLWVCRKRGRRPQGALFASIPVALWDLFLATGPEREIAPYENPLPIPPRAEVAQKQAVPKAATAEVTPERHWWQFWRRA